MKVRLKPLQQQVVVLTGATSGIGLATARMAAERGATLVLVARNAKALQKLTDELGANGATAAWVAADVGDEQQVEYVAKEAIRRFGGFDAWINDAGVSIYGALSEVETRDMRRLFDTNFWGLVYGSLAAVRHFRERGGGKLVNVGSVLGDRSIPLQGIYSASKHAVAGFTEALRSELDAEKLPVSITLIKPSAIDTPYKEHAKNYFEHAPKNPPPVYEPRVVARSILHALEHDVRDLVVGGGGRLITAAAAAAPRTADKVMARTMPYLQESSDPAAPRSANALYEPGDDALQERSGYPFTLKHSAYTRAAMYPKTTLGLLGAAGLIAAGVVLAGRRGDLGAAAASGGDGHQR
jgi:short-subunit dehydrogenase